MAPKLEGRSEDHLPDRSETGTSPALAKLYAGIAKRGNKQCRLIFTGSSTVAGTNSTHRSKRFVNILETAFHNAFPSGFLSETREKGQSDGQRPELQRLLRQAGAKDLARESP